MLTNKFLIGLSLTALLAVTNSAQALEMQAAVEKALNEHPDLQVSLNDREAIAHEIRQAYAGYLPRVDFDMGYGYEHSDNATTRARNNQDQELWRRETGIRASQNLLDGRRSASQVEREQARFMAADARVKEVGEDIALRTIEQFLEVRRHRALVGLAQDSVKRHTQYVQEIESIVNAGRASQADLEQARGRLALAEARQLQSEGLLDEAEARFFSLVGEKPTMLEGVAAPLGSLPTTVEDLIEMAITKHPRLFTSQYRVKAAEAEVKIAQSNFSPRVNFELGATDNRNIDGGKGTSDDWSAMLRLRYNIYNGGQDAAEKQEQYARLMATRDGLDSDRRTVEQNARIAWSEYQVTSQRLSPLQRHADAAEQTRAAYAEQFNLGQRTLLDLLDSEDEVFNAKAAYLTGVSSRDFAAFRMLNAKGDLLDTLGVKLPVPQKTMTAAAQ